MRPPSARWRGLIWAVTIALPFAAWFIARLTYSRFPPGAVLFFTLAACLSAALGGMRVAIAALVFNVAALIGFCYLCQRDQWGVAFLLWSAVPAALTLLVGYAREKWSASEMLADHLRQDLIRLREELEIQRADLKRFHDLSVRLSSHLELQRLLSDVLTAVAALQKTDLALLLLRPDRVSNVLRVETFTGFNADQIQLFGKFPASFFSLDRRVIIDDIERPGTNFPFPEAAGKIGFRAMFSTPIVNARGEPLGVVVTFFRQCNSPSDRQSRLVELYALQAANALDNARMYRDSLETLAAEQQRIEVLRALAKASVQIHSSLSLDSLLQTITDEAREIIGASQAFTTLLAKGPWHQSITCFSTAENQPVFDFPQASSEMFTLACTLNKPVRLNAATAADRPWAKSSEAALHSWLAAPLVTRDGRNLGLIHLSHKVSGEFTADDEAILVQLAHMASVAIDNVRLYREAQEQIAQNKRTQEALERSRESMQLAQQSLGIGMWAWELETGEIEWSDEIRRLHGFAGDSFDGHYESWMQSIHDEDRARVHDSISEALAARGEYDVQYRVVFADKSVHWLEARGRTIVIGNTPVRMLGVAMDVTSRKLAEEALRSSEKLAATGRLAASIAHEINNPLAAVINALYILRTHPKIPESALGFIKTAETELSRVVHITKQTLGFYREVAKPVPTVVTQVLSEVLSAYESKVQKGGINIQKKYRVPGQLSAFPGELRQVFSNLILNALEAIPASGILFLRVKAARNGEEQSGVQITIADNGPGIPPANIPRLFEPFFSTKGTKGTGLGLWVSQGIVEKHGGKIRVRSSTGSAHHGTCFLIFLPIGVVGERNQSERTLAHGRAMSAGASAKWGAGGNDLTAA
jgi:PAS domain S-box-containing protein